MLDSCVVTVDDLFSLILSSMLFLPVLKRFDLFTAVTQAFDI